MKVLITIECDNEAFAEHTGEEVARILGGVAKAFRYGYDNNVTELDEMKLRDVNGNTVGKIVVVG